MTLVHRGVIRSIVLMCPCGCGERLPVNLDPRTGPAWRLYESAGKISLFPSVWREVGCRAHFIVWHNRIVVLGPRDSQSEDAGFADLPSSLMAAVLDRLPYGSLVPFSQIAQDLGAVPWDVLSACRRLVSNRSAREGIKKQRGSFGR